MDKQEEKRRFVRLNALVDVLYTRSPTTEEKELTLTKNISKGGICLIAYEDLKENEVLSLKIFLPEEKAAINAVGKVVWVKEFVVGEDYKNRRFDAGV